MSLAIVGLDGMSPKDIEEFDINGEWQNIDIETVAHTIPSWNAIFSGHRLDQEMNVYEFHKMPKEEPKDKSPIGKVSDKRWDYDEIRTEDHLWEMFDINVVTAPVVLPTYCNIGGISNKYTWASNRMEIEHSIIKIRNEILSRDNVISVFPEPDKINHLYGNSDKDYNSTDRETHFSLLIDSIEQIKNKFDEWIFLSDHGKPSAREYVSDKIWVPSHYNTGVISSNFMNVENETNVTIYNKLKKSLSQRM